MTSRASRAVLLSAALALAGCGTGSSAARRAPPDSLAGTWEMELRSSPGLFRASQIIARGALTLRAAPDTTAACSSDPAGQFVCESVVRGIADLILPDSLEQRRPTDSAWAVLTKKRTVLVHLGGCCDQGEIEGTLRWRDGEYRGRWRQWFLEPGAGGELVLRVAVGTADCPASMVCDSAPKLKEQAVADCGAPRQTAGSIEGRLVPRGVRRGQLNRGIWLEGTECGATPVLDGRFRFSGVPAGTVTLVLNSDWALPVKPVPVEVEIGRATRVRIPIEPENLLVNCRAVPACARFLARLPTGGRSDDDQLQETAWRTLVALASIDVHGPSRRWVACLEGAPGWVLQSTASPEWRTARSRECAARGILRHIPTGAIGKRITVESLERQDSTRADLTGTFWEGSTEAAGWECTLERSAGTWAASRCWTRWIS